MRHRISCSYLTVMLIALLGASAPVLSNTAARVALIADKALDLDKSPLVSLLEVKLSQRGGIELLERAEIGKILQEQQLQLMFSSKGVAERQVAGKLLDVDIMITGEGFSEFGTRLGSLFSCLARLEVQATERKTHKVITSERTTRRAVDLSEAIAGKTALQAAGHQLSIRLIEKIAQQIGKGEISVTNKVNRQE